MSVKITVRCDGIHDGDDGPLLTPCGAQHELVDGARRKTMKRGWTRSRGVDKDGRRLRMDWCPSCSRQRAIARRILGR